MQFASLAINPRSGEPRSVLIARETGVGGNSTAAVGTPEQVAETILSYVDAGATTILIRGYEPLGDAIEYGRDLIPLVRQELAQRERQGAAGGTAAVASAVGN